SSTSTPPPRAGSCFSTPPRSPPMSKSSSAIPRRSDGDMASEHALDVVVRRYVLASDRPFDEVLAGIFSGISQPDIAQLFSKLETSGTYQQFSSLVEQAQGRAGLMRVWQLDLGNALTLDPEALDWTGPRLRRPNGRH